MKRVVFFVLIAVATKSISRAARTTICVSRSAHISGSEPF